MIALEGISKKFSGAVALAPLDLTLPAGKTTVLIGPSGCGKSTVIRLIVGLIAPDTGSIRVDDETVSADDWLALRRRIGYVVQDGGLFPHLTAAGNMTLMARWLDWEDARIEKRLAELTDLTHFPVSALDRYPAELSGGQRQRVALMRALMLDPDVLLLDEPLGALDPMIRFELQNDLREIFRRLGKTVVMVTHDMGEAAFFGDLIVLIRDGRIVQQGGVTDLLERPAEPFVEDFIRAQRGLNDLSREANR